MYKEYYKGQFPDVAVQKLETKVVLSKAEIEKTVLAMVESLQTGLIYYCHYGRKIEIYTSYQMLERLKRFKKGAKVRIKETDVTGIVESEHFYIISGCPCVRVLTSNNESLAYGCEDIELME